MEFVFWQEVFSIHQSALLRNLANYDDIAVTLVVWEELGAERKELGWYQPNYGNTKVLIKPTSKIQSDLLSKNRSDTFHVFSGTRSSPNIWSVLCQSISINSHVGIQSEAQKGIGVKGLLRLARSKYDALRISSKVDCILGIGGKGEDWFRRSGYISNRIFPFAYFTENPISPCVNSPDENFNDGAFNIIFVGRPLYNKGLDILMYALHELGNFDWRLHVVGDGDDKGRFKNLSQLLNCSAAVSFYGTLPNCDVIRMIQKSDLLVLPSRWDGWGAVVNEALMCGVPVVCSDICGAADLLDGSERGEVFKTNSVQDLRDALNRWIVKGKLSMDQRQRIINWTKCISGETGASYLLEIMKSVLNGMGKPICPWRN